MYGKIVGMTERRSGVSQKKGTPYDGQTLHLECSKRDVEGTAVKEQYVSFLGWDSPPKFQIGQTVLLDYDARGQLEDIEVIEED